MDVMMKMTTEDVRRLRAQFSSSLSLEQFVPLMKMNLRDRITNELDFVVGAVELFHTIDVNGDRRLEWDEFAGYMMDAGQARTDSSGDPNASDGKRYQPWSLGFRDLKTPMNRIKTRVQRLLLLPDLPAVAYFEQSSDVVYIYTLQFDQSEAPRHLATIRLHTAFQEHVVLDMCYIPTRRWLAVSSMRGPAAYLSVWQIPELSSYSHSPMMLRRIELASPQEQLTWLPTLQLLATASAVFPALGSHSTPNHKTTKVHQLLLWDLLTLTTLSDFDHRERIKGVTSITAFTTPSNRVFLVVGREDGQLTVVETESGRDVQTVDAHGHGVKVLCHSSEWELLASAGAPAYADETTHHLLVWRIEPTGRLRVEVTLRDHEAPLQLLQFVDIKQQLLSADVRGVFRIYSTANNQDKWQCLQVFHAGQRVETCVITPESALSDAVLVTAGSHVAFFDCCISREREEVLFAYYCRELNVVVAVTISAVLLWKADSGVFWKSFSYSAILQSTPPSGYNDAAASSQDEGRSITAACVDDRERKLLLGDDRGSVRVVNIVNGTVMKALDPHRGAVQWLTYALHSKRVVSVSLDGVLHICDENNPVGYYVPFGASKAQSVVLQSLRFLPDSVPGNDSSLVAKFEVVRATGNQALDLLAVLMAGSQHGESFVQLWNFALSHTQGTCVAPRQQEITSLCLLGSSGGVVGGTSTGSVYLWATTSADSTTYQCLVEFVAEIEKETQTPRQSTDDNSDDEESSPEQTSSPPSLPSSGQILHVLTLPIESEIEEDLGPETSTFLTADGAEALPMMARSSSMRERLQREANDGLYVVAGDENGVITTWRYAHAAPTIDPTAQHAQGNASALFQHEEMAMGYEAVAALHANALKRSARLARHQRPLERKAIARWRAHGSAVTTLQHSSGDPLVLLSSCASGKVKVWTLTGKLLGVLDRFATRREPERRAWRFPVDMELSAMRKEAFAMQFLDRGSSSQSKRPTARMSVLQERLSMTPEEMASERASLATPKPTRRRITAVVQPSDVSRAIRHMALAQTSAKAKRDASPRARARSVPVNAREPSLHALLTELGSMQPPASAPPPAEGGSSTASRRRFSMVTIADLKHALRPRTRGASGAKGRASAAVHCDLAPATFGRRQVVVTASAPDGRLELTDLQQPIDGRSASNQESEPRRARADGVLSYHVKLAHAWKSYAS